MTSAAVAAGWGHVAVATGWGHVQAAWASAAAPSAGSADDVGPGVLGFLVVAAIGVALFFLLRSMNKHLRKVRSVRDAGLEPGSKVGGDTSDKPDGVIG